MTNPRSVLTRTGQGQRWYGHGVGAACLAASFACGVTTHALAQAPAAPAAAAASAPAAEIDKLVGPIALYPDDLIAIILPAATNPLQLVQADRYLEKRKADPKLPVDSKWDDAVKSLLNYPDVVKKMSGDLDWTSDLGEAVVADQGAVLAAIQSFRRKAQSAGNLKTDSKQVVKTQKEIIIIEPADPQVIYVPQYNPTTVVVYSAAPVYAYYPTPYPSYYYPYPPGAAFATAVVWGAAMGAAWNGNHYNTNYSGNGNININVNNSTNINTGNINTGNTNVNRSGSTSAQSAGGSSAWSSSKQPGQVSSSVGKTAPTTRAGSTQSAGTTGAAGGTTARPQAQSAGGTSKPSAGGTGASTGAAASPSAKSSGGSDAFGDYASGHQAQKDSSRGAASTSSMSGAGSRSAPSGGGGGGGGGRRR